MKLHRIIVLSALLSFQPITEVCGGTTDSPRHSFSIGENDFLLDGQRFQIRCGELHAPRVAREYWRHRLQMIRAMGLNTVCAYLFWNMHEPQPGKFDWSGQADAAEFCRIAQEQGLWVILRPGPTRARNGRWGDCPGGCSKSRTFSCGPVIRVTWRRQSGISKKSVVSSGHCNDERRPDPDGPGGK